LLWVIRVETKRGRLRSGEDHRHAHAAAWPEGQGKQGLGADRPAAGCRSVRDKARGRQGDGPMSIRTSTQEGSVQLANRKEGGRDFIHGCLLRLWVGSDRGFAVRGGALCRARQRLSIQRREDATLHGPDDDPAGIGVAMNGTVVPFCVPRPWWLIGWAWPSLTAASSPRPAARQCGDGNH
jgi:hypothetical protein